MNRKHKLLIGAAVCLASITAGSIGYANSLISVDFGEFVEALLERQSNRNFGFTQPVEQSSIDDIPRRPDQDVRELLDVARGLKVDIFSREIGHNADQLAFWPDDSEPTHAIVCIETRARAQVGEFPSGAPKLEPSLQRIDLRTRAVETILRGLIACDGVRRTPWQTILATEEDGSLSGDGHLGNAFEILDPLATTNITVNRGADRGSFFDSAGLTLTGDAAAAPISDGGFGIAIRQALMEMAWEGIHITREGVVIAGDELRPGSQTSPTVGGPDSDGGAIFKFVPDVPSDGSPATTLADSPFSAGRVFAMRVTCQRGNGQFGQGCEKGNAAFVLVDAMSARSDADRGGATGYYRPEDLDVDPNFEGLRVCFTNTGARSALNFGEVLCIIDTDPMLADTPLVSDPFSGSLVTDGAPVDVQVFLEGDHDLNQPDNIAIDPTSSNIYVIEDNPNGDIFACLADGRDRNTLTDGCVRLLTLRDQTAEPTGFQFTADGDTAFFFIQHSADDGDPIARDNSCADPASNDPAFVRDDYCTDDMIVISGFRNRLRR